MKETGYIFDIKKYSINDGPGIRTTIFFKGCPLNCLWCHNPESQQLKPEKIDSSGRWNYYSYSCSSSTIGKEITPIEVFTEIKKDIPFYNESGGGATFSGGEPLMQPEFLLRLLKLCKEHNIQTAVDTSGYASYKIFEAIEDHTDLFLFDIKIADEELHKKYTGVSNKLITENLTKLSSRVNKIIIRIPVIPSVNDDDININKIINLLSSLSGYREVNLLPYHNSAKEKYGKLGKEYKLSELHSSSIESIKQTSEAFQRAGIPVTIGG
jgi:pyruvate formate lyase activating enzyme